MYKVLVVDDEHITREGIASIISEESGCEVIGTCANGIEAFDFIKTNKPDIVITDIRMPGLDGFGLIEKVRDCYPETKFILLSGYAEFEYAKRAVKFNVNNYILKPADEEELNNELKILADEITRDREKKRQYEISLYEAEQMKRKFSEFQLGHFIDERYYADDLNDGFRNFLEEENGLGLIWLCGEQDKICDFLSGSVLPNENLIVTNIKNDVIIICKNDLLQNIKNAYEKSSVADGFAFIIHGGISASEITGVCMDISEHKNIFTENKLYFHNGFMQLGEKYESLVSRIIKIIDSADFDLLQPAVDSLFEYPEETDACEMRFGAMDLIMKLNRKYSPEDFRKTRFLEIFGSSSKERMRTIVMRNIETFIRLEINKEHTQYSKPVAKAIEYIDANLHRSELSLGMVAENITHMNKDYFGRLFKKETGVFLTRYVMERRITKAKELLSDKDAKVYNVAKQVGFDADAKYFGKVFKKYTGMVPTEYQKTVNSEK
ncbi:MAG: response regulator [Clostridia bacterium]|nr:response regulator [Clostridia bacterium]